MGEASPSAKPVVFAYPLCGDTPQRPVNNPSLKGTVACKKDRRSQLHFVRRYPPDFLPSNYALSPRKMGSLRRRLLGHGVPSQQYLGKTLFEGQKNVVLFSVQEKM